MARKSRRGLEFWSRLVAEFEEQELSQAEFARRKRVKLATLRYWLAKLRETSPPELVRFVEVVAAEDGGTVGAAVRIRLPGGVELQLPSLPTPEYLASLDVALLRSRS